MAGFFRGFGAGFFAGAVIAFCLGSHVIARDLAVIAAASALLSIAFRPAAQTVGAKDGSALGGKEDERG